jgi:uncharacterized protein
MAEYKVDRSVTVEAGPAEVWRVITDIPTIVSWISVLKDAEEIAHLERYSAVIQDKVGMFNLRADLGLDVVEVEEERRIVVRAEGQDRQIGSRISIDVELTIAPEDAGSTVSVNGRYGITGSAATLGSSTIRRKGDKTLDEFLTGLTSQLAT